MGGELNALGCIWLKILLAIDTKVAWWRSSVTDLRTELSDLRFLPSPTPSSEDMAHLRGVANTTAGDAAVRAVSAGLIGTVAIGETAVQAPFLCDKRRPPFGTPRGRTTTIAPAGSLSIHSQLSDGTTGPSPEENVGGAQASTIALPDDHTCRC